MALVVIRKPKTFSRDGLWFDVTVGNNSISILHTGVMWSGHGDTPFTLRGRGVEKRSFLFDGADHCVLLLLEPTSEATLVVGDEEIELKDI